MATKIAVLSDTHAVRPFPELVRIFDRFLSPSDLLLHCGDFTGEETLSLFLNHPRFLGVAGNMDMPGVSMFLPARRVLQAQGFRIGMVHGWGSGSDLPEKVRASFQGQCDIVCFGHIHRRMWDVSADPFLLNPGSLSLPRQGNPGFAYLLLEQGQPPEVHWQDV